MTCDKIKITFDTNVGCSNLTTPIVIEVNIKAEVRKIIDDYLTDQLLDQR